MNKAIGELSLQCNPADAGRGLYLLSAPPKEMDMNLIKELGTYLKGRGLSQRKGLAECNRNSL